MFAGAKQAEEILGANALELAALYDQLCVIRFLHERMPEAAEAGGPFFFFFFCTLMGRAVTALLWASLGGLVAAQAHARGGGSRRAVLLHAVSCRVV